MTKSWLPVVCCVLAAPLAAQSRVHELRLLPTNVHWGHLPVHVRGALLSMGDGHGMQGDGEVSLTALETSLRGTIQVVVRNGERLNWPRAETPTHYISMGLHTDLDEAARLAVREMIDFLVKEKGLSRDDAYILCSLAVDLRVTQLVDGVKGIHAMVAKSIFR